MTTTVEPAGLTGPGPEQESEPAPEARRDLRAAPALPDRLFLLWARSSGSLVLLVMLGVGGYLAARATTALRTAGCPSSPSRTGTRTAGTASSVSPPSCSAPR